MSEEKLLVDEAYKRVRRSLLRLELAPGDIVSEKRLADQMGIGKTPVREALHRLVADGLVESKPRIGYKVVPVTIQDAHELFGLRLILEPPAAFHAANRLDAKDIETLNQLSNVLYKEGDADSVETFLDANRRFHTLITEASGNRRLARFVDHVLTQSTRLNFAGLLHSDRGRAIAKGHHDLIDALAAKDATSSQEILTREISEAYQLTMDSLFTDPSVLNLPVKLDTRVLRE